MKNTNIVIPEMNTLKGNGYTFKGDNSFELFLLPSEKESALKWKNLLPLGANSFF